MVWMAVLAMDVSLAGCGDTAAQTEALAAIEAQNAVVEAAVAEGDMARYAGVFTEDAWQASPNSAPLVGRAAIEASWTGMTALGDWAFDLETLEVWVCNGSAVERGYGELSFVPNAEMASEMPPFTVGANYLAHWVETAPGHWQVRSDVASATASDAPAN